MGLFKQNLPKQILSLAEIKLNNLTQHYTLIYKISFVLNGFELSKSIFDTSNYVESVAPCSCKGQIKTNIFCISRFSANAYISFCKMIKHD